MVLAEVGQPLVAEEKPIPTAPSGGAVVRVLYSGVCHSDVHIWESAPQGARTLPHVLGHEISGVVHELGSEVTRVKGVSVPGVGAHVIVYPWENCSECDHCKAGDVNCERDATSYKQQGVSVDGGYQQYVVVYVASQLIAAPQGTPLDVCAISACSGVTAYNAVTSLKESMEDAFRIKGEARVLLVGAGGLCLWAVSVLRAMYPGVIICVVDLLKEKVEDALQAGADIGVTWDIKDDGRQRTKAVHTALGGRRVDGAIDFTGHSDSANPIFRSLNKKATWSVVGLAGGMTPPLPLALIVSSTITIRGVFLGSKQQLAQLLGLLAQGKVTPPRISHVRLADATRTLLALKQGTQKGRAVIKMADTTAHKL